MQMFLKGVLKAAFLAQINVNGNFNTKNALLDTRSSVFQVNGVLQW